MKIDSKTTLLAAMITLFVLKLAIVFFYQDEIRVWEDDVIARNMLETGEMFYMQRGTPNYMFQFPVYPSLLFAIYKIFGYNPLYAIMLNLVMISIACFLLYQISISVCGLQKIELKSVSPEIIALISALAFLFHPFIVYYSMFKVHPFVLDLLCPVLIIFFSMKYLLRASLKNLGSLALSTGLGVLNRSMAIVALLPFVILGARVLGLRKTAFGFTIVALVSALIISPWLMRGHMVYGKASMAPMLSEVLWKGALENSDGSNYLLDGRTYKSALTQNEDEFLHGKPIPVQSQFFREKYSQLLKDEPLHVFEMYATKLKNFWLYHGNIGIEYGERIQSFLITYKIYVYCLFAFNLAAVFLFKYKPLVLLSYPLGLSLVQAVFYVETRHRMIAEPFLLFFGILAFFEIWERTTNLVSRENIAVIES